jgi:two-component system, NtrC family, response regulator AtoC
MARARILIVDDERLIRWTLREKLSGAGHSVRSAKSGEDALAQLSDEPADVVLLDIRLPGMDGIDVLRRIVDTDPAAQVVMVTACDTVEQAIRSFKEGACDYVIKPFDLKELMAVVDRAIEASRLRREVRHFRTRQRKRFSLTRVVGDSSAMREILATCAKLAESDFSTVFLLGESGTGKDLVARGIHYAGARGNRPFIEINCAALPEHLLESELLGHEKGAFTDAKARKKGLIEMADGGTLFLDEIGDMRPGLQGKLLSVIEDRRFRRVGGVEDIAVDIRIIAATNRDLELAVAEGEFREDLYYRLKVLPIRLPPLRERPEDIPLLVEHFIGHFNGLYKQKLEGISEDALRLLAKYPWPGNVRELKNVIERAIILGDGPQIRSEGLPPEILRPQPAAMEYRFLLPEEGVDLAEVEAGFLRQALDLAAGNQTRAAGLLNLSRDALRYRLKKFGIGQVAVP